jgi:hypothetical protein
MQELNIKLIVIVNLNSLVMQERLTLLTTDTFAARNLCFKLKLQRFRLVTCDV